MPFERRLHPLSFLFVLGSQLRKFVIPGVLFLFTVRSGGWGWASVTLALSVPVVVSALLRYLFFRYRYEDTELVVRSGMLVRSERHIPYARIQNLDAVRNVLHRLLGVVSVRVQTGGGDEPEAVLDVLPLAALEEMRARVSAGSGAAVASTAPGTAASSAPAAGDTLLRLSLREALLAGLLQNRGTVVMGAAFGVLLELGLLDPLWRRLFGDVFGEDASARGVVRELARSGFRAGELGFDRIGVTVAAFAALLLVLRAVSMAAAVTRLHGFTLTRENADLRTQFGMFTRVSATVPLRRIQTVTVRDGPLQRLARRVSVRVDTAGGGHGEGAVHRESLAPIVRRRDLAALLGAIVPSLELERASWQSLPPRAFQRELKSCLMVVSAAALALAGVAGRWGLILLPPLLLWAVVHARYTVAGISYATTDGAVLFRSGYLWRQLTVARYAKIQAVALRESPFDRRAAMMRLRVDTAGAGATSHRVDIPYLERLDACRLCEQISERASVTAFRW